MKAYLILLGAVALLAGCGGSDTQQIENGIRAQLAPQGTVTRVNMTKQGDGTFAGTAAVRVADGHEAQLNCTARREGSNFITSCGQVIDEQLINDLEGQIRTQLTSRGLTVTEVELAKQDDNTIRGHATVRDAAGNEARTNCTAPRDAASGRFMLNCTAATDAAAAAQATGEQAAPAEEAPAEEGGQ